MGRFMKGITPIISIIILLLITIALAATAYSYLSGYLFGQMSSSFSIPNGGIFCSDGRMTVMIRNDAVEGNLTNDDMTVTQIDGTDVTPETINIGPRDAGTVIRDDNGGSGWSRGYHEVIVGTSSNVIRSKQFCP